jgi:hypothetical protein
MSESGQQALARRPSRSAAMTTFSTEVFDNEVVPSSLATIAPILRVATETENERPRVAYLCMHALYYFFKILRVYMFYVKKSLIFFNWLFWKVDSMRLKRHTGWIQARAGVV